MKKIRKMVILLQKEEMCCTSIVNSCEQHSRTIAWVPSGIVLTERKFRAVGREEEPNIL